MIPACSHTGTPRIAFDGFFHFTSSTTSASASLMRRRTRASASPRQSPRSLILASINREGEASPFPAFGALLFLIVVVAFVMVVARRSVGDHQLVVTVGRMKRAEMRGLRCAPSGLRCFSINGQRSEQCQNS